MKQALYIIILALCVSFAYYLGQRHRLPSEPYVITYTDTVPGDSVPYAVYYPTPVPDTILYADTIPANIDTSQIIAEYLATVIYNDTLKNDTSALIVLNEQLSRNRITERSIVFQNRRKTYINIYTAQESSLNQHVLSICPIVGTNFSSLGYGLGVEYKKIGFDYVKFNNAACFNVRFRFTLF